MFSIDPSPTFENNQDTFLFSGALRTTVNDFNVASQSLSSYVSIIESVKTIAHNQSSKYCEDTLDIKELQEMYIARDRRLHALALFSLLKHQKIVCSEADKYYQSIIDNKRILSYEIYLHICYLCRWSEFCIESCRQLSPNVLVVICKSILDSNLNKDASLYSYHIVLQSIIWKLFILQDPNILTKKEKQDVHCFNFPFVVPLSLSEPPEVLTGSSDTEELYKVFDSILSRMCDKVKSIASDLDFSYVKVILHAYKLIFELLRRIKTCDEHFVKVLFKLNPLLEQYIHGNYPSEIKSLFKVDFKLYFIDETLSKLAAWEIDVHYLYFLVCTYWEEVEEMTTQTDNCLSKIAPFLPCADDRKLLMESSFLNKQFFDSWKEDGVELLKTVIQYQYPQAVRAAEVILWHPEILSSDEILFVLENNRSLLCCWKIYVSLMNAIVEINEKEAKLRLLKLFYTILSKAPVSVYNDVLKYKVEKWKNAEPFKLPDFDYQLTQFTRKAHSYEEAVTTLLPLFLQSSLPVLQMVIRQALMQGPEGMTSIRVLKHIPEVCNGEISLVGEISEYFKNESGVQKLKNMELLIETLMETDIEGNFISFDMYLRYCIIPNLSLANMKLELVLNCLNTALKVLNKHNTVNVSGNVMSSYLTGCGKLLDSCLTSGCGKIKELVVQGLNLMYEQFKMGRSLDGEIVSTLHSELKTCNPAVFVYMNQFLRRAYKDLGKASLEMNNLLWSWCCFMKDEDLLKECISQSKYSYEQLLNVLIWAHNHFTMEEWVQSIYFVKDHCQHLHSQIVPSMPWKLSDNDFHVYAAIRCATDSLSFILNQEGIIEIYYIGSCFTNTVMNFLNKDIQPELLLYTFLDMCHLSSKVKYDILTIFSSLFIGIIKSIHSCSDKSKEKYYMKLFLQAVKCLPDSKGKESLLQTL